MNENSIKDARQRGVDLFNAARDAATPQYRNAVPAGDVTKDFSTSFAPILKYGAFMNEFLGYVVNKVVLQSIESSIYENQYQLIKKDGYPLGTDIEDNYVNPAKGRDYDLSLGSTLLNVTPADVKTAYYRVNRRRQFPITIPRELLEGAFTRWEQLDMMVSGMVRSLYSGNAIEEENQVKKLLSTAVSGNVIKKQTIAWDPADPAQSALNLIEAARTISYNITHAGSDYNNYAAVAAAQGVENPTPAVTWTPLEDVVVFIRTDALVKTEVNAWSTMFNIQQGDFRFRFLPVPNFDFIDYDNENAPVADPSKILAVVADKNTFAYRDNLQTTGEFYNPAGLYQNQYLNVWQTYSVRPWGNAVALVEA